VRMPQRTIWWSSTMSSVIMSLLLKEKKSLFLPHFHL
jgi:hypothetical protein